MNPYILVLYKEVELARRRCAVDGVAHAEPPWAHDAIARRRLLRRQRRMRARRHAIAPRVRILFFTLQTVNYAFDSFTGLAVTVRRLGTSRLARGLPRGQWA